MANTRAIRDRIKGVQNTAKITKAMEMISSSKMRKAQERGLAGRHYSEKIKQVIADLAILRSTEENIHPLLEKRPVKKIGIVLITPDRGLVGGLDSNLNKKAATFAMSQEIPSNMMLVGKRGIAYMRRFERDISAEFSKLGDKPSLIDTLPISRIIIEEYTKRQIDMAYIIYAKFVNTMPVSYTHLTLPTKRIV